MSKWWECSEIYMLRRRVEKRLQLPAAKVPKATEETATQFWERVEGAGLLIEAQALYDKLDAEYAAWKHTRRETKKAFAERIEREGRQAEAERVRAELMTSGLPEREVQAELVARMQPLDGSETRAWPTPDSWSDDRLFRSKRDQEEWQSLVNAKEAKDKAVKDADWRIYCAGWRREQRRALMAARRRALALKLSASDGDD
jgi:hypothetical protein